MLRSRWLTLALDLLFLLSVFLLQLLGLLLVLLLQLLLAGFTGLLGHLPLVVLILLLLQLLPLLVLFGNQLRVLLLEFLVARHVPGVWRCERLSGRQVLGMHDRGMHDWPSLRALRTRAFGASALRAGVCRASVLWTSCRRSRSTMNHRCALFRVGASGLDMFILSSHRRNTPLVRETFFLCRRTPVNAATAAVVADPGLVVVDDRRVVHIVNVGDVHVVDRTVVEEVSVLPASAFITIAKISVTVTDSAVEADVQSPVAFIEGIAVAAPAPIAGSPEKIGLGSHHPCARHPVVPCVSVGVGPISGRPEITVARTKRLLVRGQFRRGQRNRNADLCEGCRRNGQHDNRKQERTNGREDAHYVSFCPMILRVPGDTVPLRTARMEGRDF